MSDTPMTVVDVMAEAAKVEIPHGSRVLADTIDMVANVWIGNGVMDRIHRNVDVDELWMCRAGPTLQVEYGDDRIRTSLEPGEILVIPRGVTHTASGPQTPRSVVVIIEGHSEEYERRSVHEVLNTDRSKAEKRSLDRETEFYTPPPSRAEFELFRTAEIRCSLYVRSEGTMRRPKQESAPTIWYGLRGIVRLEDEAGASYEVGSDHLLVVPPGLMYRAVGVEMWNAVAVFRSVTL